jgi:hypothetical protein
MRLAVAFGPYHGPVTANRLEDAVNAAKAEDYDALAMAGFSFDPEVSAFLDKHVNLGMQLFRVQIAPDVQIGDLLKVKSRREALLGDRAARLRGGEERARSSRVTLQGRRPLRPERRGW